MATAYDDYPEITIGPYVKGEIPEQLQYTFLDEDGDAIDITGWAVRFTYRLSSGTVDDTTTQTGVVVTGSAGIAGYSWVAADLATAGEYVGAIWAGDGTNRLRSKLFQWFVKDTFVSAPSI